MATLGEHMHNMVYTLCFLSLENSEFPKDARVFRYELHLFSLVSRSFDFKGQLGGRVTV
jgi:hypothetical protein